MSESTGRLQRVFVGLKVNGGRRWRSRSRDVPTQPEALVLLSSSDDSSLQQNTNTLTKGRRDPSPLTQRSQSVAVAPWWAVTVLQVTDR